MGGLFKIFKKGNIKKLNGKLNQFGKIDEEYDKFHLKLFNFTIISNNLLFLTRVLELGILNVNPNDEDNKGLTSLYYAIKNGNREMVKILISRGWNINYINKNGVSLLMKCLTSLSCDKIELLLDEGCDINLTTKNGNCLIECIDIIDMCKIKFLLQKGCKIELDGNSALFKLFKKNYNRKSNTHNSIYKKIKFLINNGADSNFIDKNNNNILLYLCKYDENEMLESITITNNKILNYTNDRGDSLLHVINDPKIFKMLVEKYHLNINVLNSSNQSPVYNYLDYNDDLPKWMFDYGIDFKVVDKHGHTLLFMIICSIFKKLIVKFISKSLMYKILNLFNLVKILIDNFDVNHKDADGNTVMHVICLNLKPQILKSLTIQKLMCDTVRLFLEYGYDLTLTNNDKLTVLDFIKIDMIKDIIINHIL